MPSLPLIPGNLGTTCYPASAQDFYNTMFELGSALLNTTLTGVILQDAEPAVADRDKVWIRTSGGAPVFPPVWSFYNGQWVAKHPTPASDSRLQLYVGTAGSVDTLDGGTAGVVTANTGPFWEIDTSFAFRVPMGVGTLPVSGTVVAVNDTGGLEQADVSLAQANLPAIRFPISIDGDGDAATSEAGRLRVGAGTQIDWQPTINSSEVAYTRSIGGGTPLTLSRLQPYKAVYFVRRTARQFCTQPIT